MGGKPYGLLLFFLGLAINQTYAQATAQDTITRAHNAQLLIDDYNKVIGDQAEIYNGPLYDLYAPASKGSPYFEDMPHTTPGELRYNGTLYKNVPLLYDIYTDLMVAAQGDQLFVLRQEKISDIYLLGHHFIYLASQFSPDLKPGFYDDLYAGKSQVLVKRARGVTHRVSDRTAEDLYDNKDVIYIRKGNTYYLVNSKVSVLDVFKDKKKQLNRYLSDNHIRYRADREISIAKLAAYYDQANN